MELKNIEKLAQVIPISEENRERKKEIIHELKEMGTMDISFATEEAGSLEVFEKIIDYNKKLDKNPELERLLSTIE